MQFVRNRQLFDTDTSEVLGSKHEAIGFDNVTTTVYISAGGQLFVVVEGGGETTMEVLSEEWEQNKWLEEIDAPASAYKKLEITITEG